MKKKANWGFSKVRINKREKIAIIKKNGIAKIVAKWISKWKKNENRINGGLKTKYDQRKRKMEKINSLRKTRHWSQIL